MIVEVVTTYDGGVLFINTDHILSMKIYYGKDDNPNEIVINMVSGQTYTIQENEPLPDGELGPDSLRVLAKIAPEAFRDKFDQVQTTRAAAGLVVTLSEKKVEDD